jgi:hypothetical protein
MLVERKQEEKRQGQGLYFLVSDSDAPTSLRCNAAQQARKNTCSCLQERQGKTACVSLKMVGRGGCLTGKGSPARSVLGEEEVVMELYVEIDGVLAQTNFPTQMRGMNVQLHLGLSEQEIASINCWPDFWKLPQVQAFLMHQGRQRALERVKRTALHPTSVVTCLETEGAHAGMMTLHTLGLVAYLTDWGTQSGGAWGEKLQVATARWLVEHTFPQADQLACVYPLSAKLVYLVERVRATNAPVILIDDQAAKLSEAACELDVEQQAILRQGVGVWAFGTRRLAGFRQIRRASSPFVELLPFPTWGYLEQVLHHSQLVSGKWLAPSDQGL